LPASPSARPRFESRNQHDRKLPRHARHLARHLLRRGTAYRRASVLDQQSASLTQEISRGERAKSPDLTDMAPGQRVRIGSDTRDLLRRLLASRNLRVQQQLAREIRHSIMRRIAVHVRRTQRMEAARARIRQAAADSRKRTAETAKRLRAGPAPQTVRVVGNRARRGTRPVLPLQGDAVPLRRHLQVPRSERTRWGRARAART
jgi:hypothetical protein